MKFGGAGIESLAAARLHLGFPQSDDIDGTSNLRYDLIDRAVVLGNYVPVNYHSLYGLSVLVENKKSGGPGNVPTLNINAIWSESIKSYLKLILLILMLRDL